MRLTLLQQMEFVRLPKDSKMVILRNGEFAKLTTCKIGFGGLRFESSFGRDGEWLQSK